MFLFRSASKLPWTVNSMTDNFQFKAQVQTADNDISAFRAFKNRAKISNVDGQNIN